MCLSHTRVPHEQKSSLVTARIVANEGLRKKLSPLQRFSLLRCISLTVGKVRHVTLEIAMLIALGNPRALHHSHRAVLHSAVACHRHFARRAIRTRHQLPSRASAKRAIFQGHADRIRSPRFYGKLSALGKLWKELPLCARFSEYRF